MTTSIDIVEDKTRRFLVVSYDIQEGLTHFDVIIADSAESAKRWMTIRRFGCIVCDAITPDEVSVLSNELAFENVDKIRGDMLTLSDQCLNAADTRSKTIGEIWADIIDQSSPKAIEFWSATDADTRNSIVRTAQTHGLPRALNDLEQFAS